ncbi:hypothetical protein BJF93_11715 [Xaviernesmea oryzae]|uniref:GtrA/DPMS transmembrane domain-containing protein n=1 Tax=Xaviernesmea oryzae TaxID=464029 RepID=A0A1Q9AVH3_9HYPH|nr:GtrA family protein [Xaviernesmea oryzae]OLP59388.1 hypothetical protein BJF93_11715 [Xaviernesmea oryzae]SEL62105.1 Putative flippase GtrA (transmembrane translocase of bactoprenol-linked glucose) [Xaviernesmea oryzae]
MSRFVRFLAVGAVGFAVDAGVTLALIDIGANAYVARLVAIGLALICTYLINRVVTFEAEGRANAREGARYGSIGLMTSIINYLVYSGLLTGIPRLPPLLALAAGSAVATGLSYVGYSRLVFRRRP